MSATRVDAPCRGLDAVLDRLRREGRRRLVDVGLDQMADGALRVRLLLGGPASTRGAQPGAVMPGWTTLCRAGRSWHCRAVIDR